jgi:hypothetical protein
MLGREPSARRKQSSWNDTRVIQYQKISFLQQRRQFSEAVIFKQTIASVEQHHAAAAAHGWRLLCDEFFRKAVIKF